MDGAYFRVHHFAQQLGSPFPLLAAVGAKTRKIEIGTAVIDMRYENPHYMVEDAGAADLISGGRLQLGISRGSPEQVIDGWRYFGYRPVEGEDDADTGPLDPIVPLGQVEEHGAIFESGGADVTISLSQGGHELGEDDIRAAKTWLTKETVRKKVAA
jgi:hypothetical protein